MAEEKKRPSIAEMLAAARKADGGGAKDAEADTSEASTPAAKTPAKPAAKAAAPAAKSSAPAGGKMSVADMLAAARGGGAPGASTPAAAAEKKETPKPAAKPAPAKAAKPAGPVIGTGKDTASILAAVRGTAKPGPTSKAEAAPDSKESKEAAAVAKAKLAAMPAMPVKPEYAKPKPKAPAVAERRNFIVDAVSLATGSMFALGNVALGLTGGLCTFGLARFMFPNVLTEPPSRFKVGFKDNFSPGTVETKFVAQYGIWVVNTVYQGAPEIYALKTVCTHLGCTPNWLEAEQKFKCPCHGSGFYKDGINFEGPAPRPLERYAIRIADDGQVEIDKSKIFQEEMGQWNDPSSFIPV